jgi:DNA-binding NarL/FixJ family response regulator
MPEIIEYCTEILKTDCDIVGSAASGSAALGAYAATAPDVIVLDISMPGRNGIEVAKRLRRAGSGAAIIFFSADDELVTAALEAGGSAYVSKTLVASDLRVAIAEALAGRIFVSLSQGGGRRGEKPTDV